jgi:TrmH family RNA methyltransferase
MVILTMFTTLSSPQNDRVKLVRLLQRQAKTRRQQRRLVLEGTRLVGDAFETGARPDYVCFTDSAAAPVHDLVTLLSAAGIDCLRVTETLMADMADTETPQGILGVFPWPDLPIPPVPDLVFVADAWRDPGNLGAVIRTAAAAGVDLLALMPGTVDPYNPKALRAGMGAQFRVPVLLLDWPGLVARFPEHVIYLADAAGDRPYHMVDWTRPALLVVGGEAHGLGRVPHDLPHTTIAIPMAPGAESLNAAVAASLLIYEARRHTFPTDC